MYKYNQGRFKPRYPEKYKGDANNIIYRSGLEYKVMKWLDGHPDIISWASEEHFFVVPYRDPLTGRSRRYFPDFWCEQKTKDGTVETLVIEVKPASQTKPPPMGKNGKLDRRRIKAAMTFAINNAKWESAKLFCEARNWKFITMTEKDIG